MRCFFHLVNGDETILDDMGIEVPSLEIAKSEALKAITELRDGAEETAEDWNGWRLDIACPEGHLLYSIPLVVTVH